MIAIIIIAMLQLEFMFKEKEFTNNCWICEEKYTFKGYRIRECIWIIFFKLRWAMPHNYNAFVQGFFVMLL